MPICGICGTPFENRVVISGKLRNVSKRKLCLSCSPFGVHNTRTARQIVEPTRFICPCGETNPDNFYKSQRFKCKKCLIDYNGVRCQDRKNRARQYLGGRCLACGFDKWMSSLSFHHLNPSRKDLNWQTMRGWSWSRILKELEHCIILCSNCHVAHHAGEDIFEERCKLLNKTTSTLGSERETIAPTGGIAGNGRLRQQSVTGTVPRLLR
jgi:hypothetical protein